jgi:tetrahedral aminopeptidase
VPARGGPTVSHGSNTNPVVGRLLAEAAGRAGVAYQPAPAGKLEGNDANTIQASGGGVAAAAVGIPLRNMHTQAEVCALADIDAAARLVAEFVRGLRADTDLRPFRPDGNR